MEGPIAAAAEHRGLAFVGEARGSKEIVNLIVAGLRNPDVVIVVNPNVAARLQRRGFIERSWPLGETRLEHLDFRGNIARTIRHRPAWRR
jgi:hypothetical protein